jgi:hypothetical protein
MNSKQVVKITMKMSVRDCVNNNSTVITAIPGFDAVFKPFSDNIVKIQNLSEQQTASRKGITINKSNLRSMLIMTGKDIAAKTEAFAVNTDNTELAAEIHFPISELNKVSSVVFRDICQLICDRATANAAALINYGVTAADISDFQTRIDAFNVSIPKPKLGNAEKKQLTKQLSDLFSENDTHLVSMDKLIEIVRYSQPDFYELYKNCRKLNNIGHKLVLKLNVIGADDKKPINRVELQFVRVNADDRKTTGPDTKPVSHKTSVHGGANVKHLPQGVYSVTLTKNGYKPQTVIINITHGETAKSEIAMERAE